MPTKVYLIDDDPAIVHALRTYLESKSISVSTYESADQFAAAFDRGLSPGFVVCDVRLPGKSGLDLLLDMSKRVGRFPVILMTGHGDIDMAVRAMKAGALDFLPKPFDPGQLLNVMRQFVEADAASSKNARDIAPLLARYNTLTERQREVMRYAVEGHTNKEVGLELGISPRTVEIHRAQVMQKMHADSVPQLVRFAILIGQQ